MWRQLLLANRVRLELDRGRWGEAAQSADHLLRDPSCTIGARLEALVALGLVRARNGDPWVWEQLDDALRLSEATDELQAISPTAAARAEAAWLEGRTAEVGQATESALNRALQPAPRRSPMHSP